MTPDEHQLISGLFERMRALGPVDKDRDAESLIMQSVLGTPDAAYKLVQSVLVQESALDEAARRIEQLEQRIQQLESGAQQARPSSGGFLGGLFGGSKPTPQAAPMQRSSVPSAGYGQPQQPGSPWGQQGGGYQGGGYQQGGAYQPQQAPQRAGGGFMKTAVATAAGVAGGLFVANAIGSMMGGNHAQASTGNQAGDGGAFNASGTTGAEGAEPQYQDPGSNDPGNYDQDQSGGQDEGGGGWFGGDSGSDDSEF